MITFALCTKQWKTNAKWSQFWSKSQQVRIAKNAFLIQVYLGVFQCVSSGKAMDLCFCGENDNYIVALVTEKLEGRSDKVHTKLNVYESKNIGLKPPRTSDGRRAWARRRRATARAGVVGFRPGSSSSVRARIAPSVPGRR